MASYPIPITRIEGGGYVTDVDAWGRTIASNLPPTHIIHRELEGLKQQAEEHASDNQILRETIHEYKRKVGELRAKLRTEATADVRPTHASLYQRVDSAISTADANILRAILREVCRESEKAANIAASILPSPPSPVSERSTATRGSTSTTRTTSTRRTSVRFQEPPVPVSGFRPTTTRRASSRVQDLPVPANADLSAGTAKEHDRGMRKRREKVTDELSGDYFDPGYTTPRRPKRRAEDEVEEPSSRKRRSTVPLTCATCKKEYNPAENERGGCKRHSGYKKVDPSYHSFWDDWDEDVHGECEQYINDPEYAAGFVWSCCGEYLDVKRCTASKHLTKDELRAKRSTVYVVDMGASS